MSDDKGYEINRHAGAIVALGFLSNHVAKREMWFDAEDLEIDDDIEIPGSGRIKVTVEYDLAESVMTRDSGVV